MTITGTNLKFIASEQMTDSPSLALGTGGGGHMSTTTIIDGVENNVFPDVMPADRASGKVEYRKVYAAVMSNDNGTLANARVGIAAQPTDPNVRVTLIQAADDAEVLAGFKAVADARSVALIGADLAQTRAFAPAPAGGSIYAGATAPEFAGLPGRVLDGGGVIAIDASADPTVFQAGNKISGRVVTPNGGYVLGQFAASSFTVSTFDWATISAASVAGAYLQITLLGQVLPPGAIVYVQEATRAPGGRVVCSTSLSTGAISAGATSITLNTLYAPTAPVTGSVAQPAFFRGDTVMLQHPTVAATRELRLVTKVDHITNQLIFAGTTNAYPTGTIVSVPLPLGALQAKVTLAPFAQQAWLKRFTSSVEGVSATINYSGAIGMHNQGGTTDRWALVFTSPTQFAVMSERRGQIATGNTTTDFSPLNPATSQPLFTLYASGWGAGALPGNVVRFDTQAAAAPFWERRDVSISSPGSTNQASIYIQGDVDA